MGDSRETPYSQLHGIGIAGGIGAADHGSFNSVSTGSLSRRWLFAHSTQRVATSWGSPSRRLSRTRCSTLVTN